MAGTPYIVKVPKLIGFLVREQIPPATTLNVAPTNVALPPRVAHCKKKRKHQKRNLDLKNPPRAPPNPLITLNGFETSDGNRVLVPIFLSTLRYFSVD